MTEKLLQYIWQFGYFNRSQLCTTTGEPVQILFAGSPNTNQGPDFLNAQIKIGPTLFAGSVELHLLTSHWKQHRHDGDLHYRNVVLHVVYENDLPAPIADIPVLELQQRIPRLLLEQFGQLMQSAAAIPCAHALDRVSAITWLSWKERLLAERLGRKAALVFEYLKQNNNHWDESLWWLLARVFGGTVNADAFEAMAQTIPLAIVARHKQQIHQLEALLFGQAGLLGGAFEEDYPKLLQREYRFLQNKYSLQPINRPLQFLRMRPGNFPSVRLAQLAMFCHQSGHLFSQLLEMESLVQVCHLFEVTANDYWHYHYRFDEAGPFKKKKIGRSTINHIIVNAVVPMLFAHGSFHASEKQKAKALLWLEQCDAENNSITRSFVQLGVHNQSAFDSQALIELKTHYCNQRFCLKCAVGNAVLKSS